jgi:hypothetical protein
VVAVGRELQVVAVGQMPDRPEDADETPKGRWISNWKLCGLNQRTFPPGSTLMFHVRTWIHQIGTRRC